MIGPGWMPSRPRPIGRGKLLSCRVGGPRRRHARRPCRAAPAGSGSPAPDYGDGLGAVPVTEGNGSIAGWGPRDSLARGNPCGVALPTATLRATTAAWHRVAAGDLQRWIGERWSWLRPRTVPIIVAFAAMLAMMDAVKRLTIYARGDDVVQLPAAHNCVAHRAASPREHTRPLLMIEGAGSVAGAPLAEQYPFRSPRD